MAKELSKDTTLKRAKCWLLQNKLPKPQKRIALALEQLVKSGANPDNIVVIGYCLGTGVLEAARGHLNVKA
jgi:dienelactone hydrolase